MNDQTVFLIGSGVVESSIDKTRSSWAVVRRALQTAYLPQHHICEDNQEFVLATLVFKMRFFTAEKKVRRDKVDIIEKALTEVQSEYKNVTKALNDDILNAQKSGEIYLAKEFDKIIKYFATDNSEIFTTNWDTLIKERIEDSKYNFPVYHLHGSAEKNGYLYLPSEITHEPYREANSSLVAMDTNHSHALSLLENASRIVVYGLSLSPLDAELAVLVGQSLFEKKNSFEIHVVDINPQVVKERLKFFNKNCKIETHLLERFQ